MNEFWKTIREFGPPICRHWKGLVVLVLGEIYAVGVYVSQQVFPTAAVMSPPVWLIVLAILLPLIVVQFLVLHDLRKQREALKDVTDYEVAIDRLSEMFNDGNERLLNGDVNNEREYGAWKVQWDQWRDQVEAHLQTNFGKRERNMFRNTVLYTLRDLGGFNLEHNRDKSQVAHKLEMLRSTMIRHSDRSAKWRSSLQSGR